MTLSWDIFGDEQKARDGKASGLGLLVLEAGVVCQTAQILLDLRNRLQGSGGKIGSVHWSQLHDREGELARRWLEEFLRGPLTFFVYIPAALGSPAPRLDLVCQAIEKLEVDQRVPGGGLKRDRTTLHLDYDNCDARELHTRLVREFGLLRAFHWSDRDSVLLQLADLLLGISSRERSGLPFGQSSGDVLRQSIVAYARDRARHFSFHLQKDNWVFCYEPGGALRRLLV